VDLVNGQQPYNNGSTSANQAESKINLCCATTVRFANVSPYLSVECSDVANNIGTKVQVLLNIGLAGISIHVYY
jgi:hypothetical protein